MSHTSAGHPLDLRDPANCPPCLMERLADRINDSPKPWFMRATGVRTPEGTCFVSLLADLNSPDQIDDLINYLARVKG